MWTLLVFLCLVSSFDIGTARKSVQEEPFESKSESAELPPVRLPRKFYENSRTRRLHIENQTGFDGKVERIHINSEEDLPGIHAYGAPKKILLNNGQIERMLRKEIQEELASGPRAMRAIMAYGKSKKHLENNGEIERVQSPVLSRYQVQRGTGSRVARSIEAESRQGDEEGSKTDLTDLETQDAKVFRPLFVYRQQQAKRQHRGKNQIYGYQTSHIPYYQLRPVY